MVQESHTQSKEEYQSLISDQANSVIDEVMEPTVKELSDADLRKLLIDARHKVNAYNSTLAKEVIGQLDMPHLRRLLVLERNERKRRTVLFAVIGAVLIAANVALMAISHFKTFVVGWFPSLIGVAAAASSGYKSGVMAIARFNNTESVGELINALDVQDRDLQLTIRPTLSILLRELKASDGKYIDADARKKLRDTLKTIATRRSTFKLSTPHIDSELMLSALVALQQVGDASFVPLVSAVATGEIGSSKPHFKQAAAECLPFLQQAAANFAASGELLRGASAHDVTGSGTLVRPATDPGSSPPDQLLRAAD